VPIRALKQVVVASQPRATLLAANAGWQPIYSQEMDVVSGDVLSLIGQTQLTVDSAPTVGQQLRLTVDGQPVGTQATEINVYSGGHHLPMQVYGLAQMDRDGPVTVSLEGSAFHSDGNFPVTVDQQENLSYGNLLIEHYRAYGDLSVAWADGALLLTEVHDPPALRQDVWCLQPYVQEALAALTFPANQGDVLRATAQAVAARSFGLEQFTGVVTADGVAISPYGGQNVDLGSPFAPLLVEAYQRVGQDGRQFLEQRVYGAFGQGLTILPDSARLQIARFGSYGRELRAFSQERVQPVELTGAEVEVYATEVELKQGDLLRSVAAMQVASPGGISLPGGVQCRLVLEIAGPATGSSYTQKTLTAEKSALPLTTSLTFQAPRAGCYRVLARVTGQADGPFNLALDGQHSQVQNLLYSMP
jgi:hypothetical protein